MGLAPSLPRHKNTRFQGINFAVDKKVEKIFVLFKNAGVRKASGRNFNNGLFY